MNAEKTLAETPPEDCLWTVDDVARYLRMSRSWVQKASSAGRLPTIRLGATVRFDPETIRAWARGERGGKVITLPRR